MNLLPAGREVCLLVEQGFVERLKIPKCFILFLKTMGNDTKRRRRSLVKFASKFTEALMNDILLPQGIVRSCSRAKPACCIVDGSC